MLKGIIQKIHNNGTGTILSEDQFGYIFSFNEVVSDKPKLHCREGRRVKFSEQITDRGREV